MIFHYQRVPFCQAPRIGRMIIGTRIVIHNLVHNSIHNLIRPFLVESQFVTHKFQHEATG